MKKVVSVLLVLSLLAACAFADAPTYDGEILFRGLPWGCSINDAVANIQAAGVTNDRVREDCDVHDVDYSFSVDSCGFSYSPSDLPNDFFVAGHLVEQVAIDAIYGIVDGKISHEREDSRMYCATYYFKDQANIKDVYDDLVSKLTSMYGTPVDAIESYYDHNLMWTGTNNAAIIIEMDDGDYPLLHITYWDFGIHDMIAEMQSLAYIGDADSTDGL